MLKKILIPKGTSDIFPSDIPAWHKIENSTRQLFTLYNYKEIRTPVFEDTGLFKRSLGQSSDVVNKQLLELASDKKNFCLRPEGTAPVIRSYIENSMEKKESLSKLFYIGPMFRGERPQKGRLRQFHQIGAEAIGPGTSSPYLDAEIIALCVNLLDKFGLKNFQLKINTLGSSEDKENFSKMLREEFKPSVQDLCDDCRDRFDRNVFRILDCKNKNCRDIISRSQIGDTYLSEESRRYYREVKAALDGLGIKYIESSTLVRGLDYYTHTVFEISDFSLGSQDALGAGGRYNNLVSQLGGADVDAIGFALGIERILLAMHPEHAPEVKPLTAYLIVLDKELLPEAFQILDNLRSQGIAADINYRVASIKSQMRAANKSGARSVIIIGEDEIKKQCVTFKDMEQGMQEEVSIKDKKYEALVNKLL